MEQKPALVNKQKVVYHFQLDQCRASYDGYTSRNLHQTVDEQLGKTAIGEHMRTHGSDIFSLSRLFSILRKRKNKWPYFMFEVLSITNLKLTLNKQRLHSLRDFIVSTFIFYFSV